MKEKLLGILVKVKEHKNIVLPIAFAVLALIIILVVLFVFVLNGKPRKYQDKIKQVTKALTSESKMKTALNEVIDVRGVVAWEEADQKTSKFNKEYKAVKKDSDDIKDKKDELKEMAEKAEEMEYTFKVSKIKEPKKDSKNSKIYTVTATLSGDYDKKDYYTSSYYSSIPDLEYEVKFVFYKNKIIDIIDKDSKRSFFKNRY